MYTYEIKPEDSRYIVMWHSTSPRWVDYEKCFDKIEDARNFVETEIFPDRSLQYDGCDGFDCYDPKGEPVYGSANLWQDDERA